MKLENKFLVVVMCLLALAAMVVEVAVRGFGQPLQFTPVYSMGCASGLALILLGRRLIAWLERD